MANQEECETKKKPHVRTERIYDKEEASLKMGSAKKEKGRNLAKQRVNIIVGRISYVVETRPRLLGNQYTRY